MKSAVETENRAKRILIIEDDRAVFGAIAQLLMHYGYEVMIATTLAEGRVKYAQNPDLIVLDLMLPDGDGTDFLEKIRMSNTPTRVFVLSGNTSADKDRKVRRLVPTRMFKKPFNFYEILDAIHEEFPQPSHSSTEFKSLI